MNRLRVAGLATSIALSGCGTQLVTTSAGPHHILSLNADVGPRNAADTGSGEIDVTLKDGRTLSFALHTHIRNNGKYLSFRGKGFQFSYPLNDVAAVEYVSTEGRTTKTLVNKPYCLDPSGTCCDAFVGCYTNSPDPTGDGGGSGDVTYVVDFRLGGGYEVCNWDLTVSSFDCSLPSLPNTGDGWKGNVVKDYTWSASRKEATIDCNPASITSKTQGSFEYTEFRPGQLPAFTVKDSGVVDPNTEVVVHFHPSLSTSSQVASLFLFVWPSIGPAASCNAAPARPIP